MASTEPVRPGGPRASGDCPGDRSGGSRWWVVTTFVVLVVVLVALLVAQPWADHETEPLVVPTASPSPTNLTPLNPTPTPTPSATASTPPVPGEEAVFDDQSAGTLLVRRGDLEATVPAAADGVETGIGIGELEWGLPEGSSVEPERCTTAVTVVPDAPAGFVARSFVNDGLDFLQQVVRLDDAAAAQEAFRELVTTIDGCPTYAQVNPGIDGATWTAQPAIEGQGVYPAVVQEVLHGAEGVEEPSYRGHVLVGNTIVTWTATAVGEGDADELLATLGTPETLSTMVQQRAHDAVLALG